MENFLDNYYSNYDEENRLASNHGKVEFITTVKYIEKYLKTNMKILEVGAGTGRYSLYFAKKGYEVEAIELIPHNLSILKSHISKTDRLKAMQGNALDLSRYQNETFDITLVLGPMYHLYNDKDKKKALEEAIRVTKKGGVIFVSYCMNEATVIQFCFQKNNIHACLEKNMLTKDFHCISTPKDLFELVRIEDIERLNKGFKIKRLSLIATDGATNYMREIIDNMDEKTFAIYLDYHLKTCERQDLIGATHHSLDILLKE